MASGSGRGGEAAISWMVLLKLGVASGEGAAHSGKGRDYLTREGISGRRWRAPFTGNAREAVLVLPRMTFTRESGARRAGSTTGVSEARTHRFTPRKKTPRGADKVDRDPPKRIGCRETLHFPSTGRRRELSVTNREPIEAQVLVVSV